MGVYNGEKFVDRAIQSILNQDFLDWEFIICNDGSNDNTQKVLSKYKDQSKFVILQNNNNHGLGYTLNKCLKFAHGEYVARMDADDVSYPNRLGEQVRFLEKNPHVSVLGTYASLFDDNGVIWGNNCPPIEPILDDWLKGPSVIHASVIMNKKKLEDMGGYDTKALRIEDYDLWLRMLSKDYLIHTLPNELYGIHWNVNDYYRKENKYRILDFKYRIKRFRDLKIPLYKYIICIKPLLPILIPKFLLYKYHYFLKRKMKTVKYDMKSIYDICTQIK